MEDILYHSRISHSEKTVEQLYKIQYRTYEKQRVLLRMLIGLIFILVAVVADFRTWAKALLLLAGTWFLINRDFPAVMRADKALSERSSTLPDMEYTFTEDSVHLLGEGSMDIPYARFTRLVEDGNYFYLFIAKESACMMERTSLTPNREDEFKQFLAERTGLNWRKEKPFLSMTLRDIRQMIRDTWKN